MFKTRNILSMGVIVAMFATVGCIPDNPNAGFGGGAVTGCTDAAAVNFNPSATNDDGSCLVIERSQNAVFFDHTATWCGPCGSWGFDAFRDELALHGEEVLGMAVHSSGSDFELPESIPMAGDKGISGIPSHRDMSKAGFAMGSSYSAAISATLAGTSSINSGLTAKIEGTTLNVTITTAVFDDIANEVFMSVIVLESGISSYQNGAPGSTEIHDHLPRAFLNGQYGESIGAGLAAGATIEKQFDVALDPAWNTAEMEVYVFLWEKDGSDYWIINADRAHAN